MARTFRIILASRANISEWARVYRKVLFRRTFS
jgi:hypothetical protein